MTHRFSVTGTRATVLFPPPPTTPFLLFSLSLSLSLARAFIRESAGAKRREQGSSRLRSHQLAVHTAASRRSSLATQRCSRFGEAFRKGRGSSLRTGPAGGARLAAADRDRYRQNNTPNSASSFGASPLLPASKRRVTAGKEPAGCAALHRAL
ncbi:hypothetical protein GN956_G7396 [Arapaima gigas]